MNRLRELDFLRGIAILLVLLRHVSLFSFTTTMGWIGVDLFFVLSGFLVSGLLFKEFIKFGNIQPKLFLIRRGFKIYPIYFLFYGLYLIPIIKEDRLNILGLLADVTFTQNYLMGWGYACGATWSLAVEEHFYFGLVFFLWIGLKFNKNILQTGLRYKTKKNKFEVVLLSILGLVLVLRFISNAAFPQSEIRNFTMTHLRIDSLLFGVLISYFYFFKKSYLEKRFEKYKHFLYLICFCGLLWTPFIEPLPSFFVKTIGFTFLYISFGILLTIFLLKKDINQILNKIFTAKLVTFVSKIGYCSYSIYIIHSFCIDFVSNNLFEFFNLSYNKYLEFFVATVVSVVLGMIMTFKIEKYFLNIRDKYYPSRVL